MSHPPIVSAEQWRTAREALLVKEKAMTRALDALAAERRRLPMVKVDEGYVFENLDGKKTLAELFDGRRQLAVYHFMSPTRHLCSGCSSMADNVPAHLEHLHARDVTFVMVSRTSPARLQEVRDRMGWTAPWYASVGEPDFHQDMVGDPGFGFSVFLRLEGADAGVYRTWFTSGRGVEHLRMDFNVLDLMPYGRQETWEDSPAGWPQTPPYEWWRLHDEY